MEGSGGGSFSGGSTARCKRVKLKRLGAGLVVNARRYLLYLVQVHLYQVQVKLYYTLHLYQLKRRNVTNMSCGLCYSTADVKVPRMILVRGKTAGIFPASNMLPVSFFRAILSSRNGHSWSLDNGTTVSHHNRQSNVAPVRSLDFFGCYDCFSQSFACWKVERVSTC